MIKKLSKTTLLAALAVSLGACAATKNSVTGTLNSLGEALAYETTQESYDKSYTASDLKSIEATYKANNKDPQAAINYARVLREFDYLNRAAIILRPFAQDYESPASAKTEYAAVQLAMGNYEDAQAYAQIAIDQDPDNFDAYHYLGIALDTQGRHIESEEAFRNGLDRWQGDPTPIMNNLALNLASQGYFTESIALLEKAVQVSPDRIELMRNLRIINTLKESSPEKKRPAANVPIPPRKAG